MTSKKSTSAKKIFIGIAVASWLALAGATTYLFIDNRDLKDQASLTTEEQNRRLTEEIRKVFDLPDETPIVARVTNVEEFKTTYPTFDNAQDGDYLLFFRKNRLNVLYRQSEKRVVKTADVVLPITVQIFGTQDAIDDVKEKLQGFGNQITVSEKVDNNINQAFVFDVDGDQEAETKSIADQLGSDVGSTLPSSITPDANTEVVIAAVKNSAAPADPATEN